MGAEPRYQLAFIGGYPQNIQLPEDPNVEFICFGACAEELIGVPVGTLIDSGGGTGVHTPQQITRLCGRQYEFRVTIPEGSVSRDRPSFKVNSILSMVAVPPVQSDPNPAAHVMTHGPSSGTAAHTPSQQKENAEQAQQEILATMSPPPQTPQGHMQSERRAASPDHNRTNDNSMKQSDQDALCDQDTEHIDHLLVQCPVAKEVWWTTLNLINMPTRFVQEQLPLIDFWARVRQGLPKHQAKGMDSLVMLISWHLWKARNAVVFRGENVNAAGIV